MADTANFRRKSFQYLIDISGTCNLRCPSCPVGNFMRTDFQNDGRTKGFMSVDYFKSIMERIKKDRIGQSTLIVLYNWGEPLIHPEIAKVIETVHQYGFNVAVSSNLSNESDLKNIVKAQPNYFRASISGYKQDVYGRSHRGGDVSLVISNLYRLRHYMTKFGKDFFVEVYYHIYRHNCGDDIAKIKSIADDLKFRFNTQFAYYMPIEKMMKAIEGEPLSEEDKSLVDNLLISPKEQSDVAVNFINSASDCTLRRDMIAINWDGSVPLCCGVYDYQHNVAPDFLSMTHDEIQALRYGNKFCGRCMAKGGHLIGENLPPEGTRQLRALGNVRLAECGSKVQFR